MPIPDPDAPMRGGCMAMGGCPMMPEWVIDQRTAGEGVDDDDEESEGICSGSMGNGGN